MAMPDTKTWTAIGTVCLGLIAAAGTGWAWFSGLVQFETKDCAERIELLQEENHQQGVALAVANERLANNEARIDANETAIEACTTALEGTP